MPEAKWMLYGAYGYTGVLIAEEAARRGHRPILAGRDAGRLRPLAERLGLDWQAVPLDDADALREAVTAVNLVLHAAGPYSRTGEPMVRACLAGITSYLDISGEIPYFQALARLDQAAYVREIAIIPGVGFDVVPTDCLANHVAAQVPNATGLEIGIRAITQPSTGTGRTSVEIIARGGLVRRQGRLQPYPLGQGARRLPFPHGERLALPVPWPDLESAHRSTGIPNITVYLALPAGLVRAAQVAAPLLRGLLAVGAIRRLVQAAAGMILRGPDAGTRQQGRSEVWARASNAQGQEAQAWLVTPEAYRFTALAAVRAVERTLETRPKGMLTPAQAFGADFVLEIEDITRLDAPPT